MMGAVFAMQGLGQFGAGIIALIAVAGFKESLLSGRSASNPQAACDGVCLIAVDKIWRIIIGMGAVPGCIALYFRLTIPEVSDKHFNIMRDLANAV